MIYVHACSSIPRLQTSKLVFMLCLFITSVVEDGSTSASPAAKSKVTVIIGVSVGVAVIAVVVAILAVVIYKCRR